MAADTNQEVLDIIKNWSCFYILFRHSLSGKHSYIPVWRAFSAFWPRGNWSESKKSTKLSLLQFCAEKALHMASLLCRLGSPRITVTFTQCDQYSIVNLNIWITSCKSFNIWTILFRCLYVPPRWVLYRQQVQVHQSNKLTALQTAWLINSNYHQVKPFYQVNMYAWYPC